MKSGDDGNAYGCLEEDIDGLIEGRVKAVNCNGGPERSQFEGLVETRSQAESWTQYRGNAQL